MADHSTTGATGTHSSTDAPNLNDSTHIESGGFDNEKVHSDVAETKAPAKKVEDDDEEEEEDIDALIDDLESQDGHEEAEDEQDNNPTQGRIVPEDLLQTDTRVGLTEDDVTTRRKKFGLNQMKEEKENLILKFLGYFIGPIQFVMEVCFDFPIIISQSRLYALYLRH
jgi:H+-transporting ATPase